MYRIELAPGEVTVFRTIEELATGVRNGVITPGPGSTTARPQKWLPIEFHPHYKQALELLSGKTADSHAPKPAERPSGGGLMFLNVPISPLVTIPPAPAAHTPATPPAPAPAAQAPTQPPVVQAPVVQAPAVPATPSTGRRSVGIR